MAYFFDHRELGKGSTRPIKGDLDEHCKMLVKLMREDAANPRVRQAGYRLYGANVQCLPTIGQTCEFKFDGTRSGWCNCKKADGTPAAADMQFPID